MELSLGAQDLLCLSRLLCLDDPRGGPPAAHATYVDYLAAVEAALQRRCALDLALEETWPQSPFETTIARLRCFRGIDTLSAHSDG